MEPPIYRREHTPLSTGGGSLHDTHSAHGISQDTLALQQRLSETTLLLELLATINGLITTTSNFEVFCSEVGRILKEKLNYSYIHIWIIDEKNGDMLKLVTPEQSHEYRTAPISRGLIGRAVREGKTIVVPDVRANSDYINVHHETRSEICLPLIDNGVTIGVINIESDTPQNFKNVLPILGVIAENFSHSLRVALLYKTETHYLNLIENMSEGVCLTDSTNHTLYTNKALEKMTGFSREELRGKSLFDYFDSTSKHRVKESTKNSAHFEGSIIGKDGEKIAVIFNIVPFETGGSMATITDVRPIKMAESKLRHTEQFLASITQHCQEAIVGLDENGMVYSWNVGAERMFGYKTPEVVGKSTHIIVPEDKILNEEVQTIIHEARMKGFVRNFETVRLHKNGKPILISLTASAIRDEKDEIIGFSLLYRDITAQKKWEREIQDRFEKMQDAYREMGKQRRYLDYLMELISIAATPAATAKQISTFIVNAMVLITRVDAATLRLLDRSTGKLILQAQSGLSEEWWSKKSISYSGSIVETAVKNGHPLKILDILNNHQYTAPSLARRNNLRSALVLPLEAKGEILGSLILYLSQEGNLSLLDDEFITIFARQASLALKLINS